MSCHEYMTVYRIRRRIAVGVDVKQVLSKCLYMLLELDDVEDTHTLIGARSLYAKGGIAFAVNMEITLNRHEKEDDFADEAFYASLL